MCGIFACQNCDCDYLKKSELIKHRGPDNTQYKKLGNNTNFVFHRLSINGLDENSNQPMELEGRWLICNGEIYNYRELIKKHGFDYKSNSDCEIVLHLYLKYGIEFTVKELDGVFAFIIYDNGQLIAARDPIGIRSMYYSFKDGIQFASEAKALNKYSEQFPAGYYYIDGKFKQYYNYEYNMNSLSEQEIIEQMRYLLINAVNKRMMSDRKICTLLSGGLDSSLVTALVARNFEPYTLDTYSIGMQGSVDLKYARLVSEELRTNHHEILLKESEFLNAIEETIYQIESYCTTSVRASVGNYLVSKYIKKNSENIVVFCGDVADELYGSYRGFMKADCDENFYEENLRMIRDVHFFDVLRSDKSISGSSLEARVPYADKSFVNFVMSIPPKYKRFDDQRIEKYLLRKAFDGILNKEVLWRRKEAFSDGVSCQERSWFQIIKEHVDIHVSDDEYEKEKDKYNGVYDKESYYYRKIFEKYYPNRGGMVPYYWRHPFSKNLDPSARLLQYYKE